jgi:hypothetical protein
MSTYERVMVSDKMGGRPIWEESFVAFEDNHIHAIFLEIRKKKSW